MITSEKMTRLTPFLLLLLAIASLTFSCKKKETATSTLIVRVLYDNEPIGGIHVFTVPYTSDVMTDIYGLARIESVASGEYAVYAEAGFVTGKSIITLGSGEVQNVSVDLNYTGPIPFIPELSFVLPDISCDYAPGDTVFFRVQVSNYREGSQISWSSDLDGQLAQTPIDATGFSDFSTSTLSAGMHVITAKAEGKEGYNAIRLKDIDMTGPKKVYLWPPEISGNSITLRWSKYSGSDFGFYQANCRYNNKPGEPYTSWTSSGHITGQSDTSITFTLPPLFCKAQWYILAGNADGKYNISNYREMTHDLGPFFSGVPVQMMLHPQKSMVYLVFQDKTLLYDYHQKSVVATGNYGATVSRTDLGDNGAGPELYLPKGNSLYILDGNTLELKKTVTFSRELLSVASSGLGFVICSQVSDADGIKPLQVYSLSQQAIVSEGGDAYDNYYMKKVPGRNALVACTRNGYGSWLDYFEFDNSGTVTLHKTVHDAAAGYSPEVMEMSPNGIYFCVGSYAYFRQTNQDLTSVAYLADTDEANDFAFSAAGDVAYCSSENTGIIWQYHYPSGTPTGSFAVYALPVHIALRNNEFIVVSQTGTNTECCVEAIPF
jgi:hypothetical protein